EEGSHPGGRFRRPGPGEHPLGRHRVHAPGVRGDDLGAEGFPGRRRAERRRGRLSPAAPESAGLPGPGPVRARVSPERRGGAMMEYQGYVGRVEYDAEGDTFHGEVVGTRDVITFEGRSVEELHQ